VVVPAVPLKKEIYPQLWLSATLAAGYDLYDTQESCV
jgi:hypothetical protein